jgi:hypothetical protein
MEIGEARIPNTSNNSLSTILMLTINVELCDKYHYHAPNNAGILGKGKVRSRKNRIGDLCFALAAV